MSAILRLSSHMVHIRCLASMSLRRKKAATLPLPNTLRYVHVLIACTAFRYMLFFQDVERSPESRKLELNGYLTKPTTRLARYPLLFEAVLKNTPEGHPDAQMLPRCVKIVREFLGKVNEETGKSENRFNLAQLDQQLVFRPNEAVVRASCRNRRRLL